MDPNSLVKEQIDAGEALIRKAQVGGLGLAGGACTQVSGDGHPYLYLIAPEVENRGVGGAYRTIGLAEKELAEEGGGGSRHIEWFTVKVIPPSDPLAQGILRVLSQYPDDRPTRHLGSVLGSVYVEGAYIYPATLFAQQPTAAS